MDNDYPHWHPCSDILDPKCGAAARQREPTMPEAFFLRKIQWQYFITLTFAGEEMPRGRRLKLVFAFLRRLSKYSKTHFLLMKWFMRWERGTKTGRGHYHICVAHLRTTPLDLSEWATTWWSAKAKAKADIQTYVDGLGGIDYCLKQTRHVPLFTNMQDEDCQPTLSHSITKRV